ncbi:MAG: GNAT family N-acetyltransferase [Clostridiales bacterium]|nr:GNAT family N-acetyltransferase [Clostridiales bacterium]
MDIVIRKMEPQEAKAVYNLGLKTFHSMEGIFMGKPKQAIVAVSGEEIVGGITYSTHKYKDGVLGYVDYAFVNDKYHGRGIGSKLYTAAVRELNGFGCTQVISLVRGDNPGSFMLFERQNMQRCSMGEAKRLLGTSGWLYLLFRSVLSWGPAMDCYLSNAKKKCDGISQFFLYLLVNLAFLLLGIMVYKEQMPLALAGAGTVMIVGSILGASICLSEKGQYHFRLSTGGGYVTAIVSALGGFFPMFGKWYPQKFDGSEKQKAELGVSAIIEWVGILLLYVAMKEGFSGNAYAESVAYYSSVMTVFRMIPTFPFNEYGARRVYSYNKGQYAVLWILSGLVLYFV